MTFQYPPEWEHQEAVWFSWPPQPDTLVDRPTKDVIKEMIRHLIQYVNVSICVQNDEEKKLVEKELAEFSSSAFSIKLFIIPHDTFWTRDFGPIFLTDKSLKQKKVLSFKWNEWGYDGYFKTPHDQNDANVAHEVAEKLHIPSTKINIVSEGGDREFNGKGTLIVCEAVELQRNPNKSKEEITDILKQAFNIQKVIWMKEGVLDDQQAFRGKLPGGILPCMGTGGNFLFYFESKSEGHVDEFVRFIAHDTIFLAQVAEEERDTPIGAITHKRLEENYEILKNEKDQDGNPFHIVRVTLPPLLTYKITPKDSVYEVLQDLKMEDGATLDGKSDVEIVIAASYLNFIITNGLVLVSKYYKEGRSKLFQETDSKAKELFEKYYPTRKVVQIDTEVLNCGGGGMHCITQQEPSI